MEESFLSGVISAIWFGILTSISPCPLATNIAAISFIGKKVGNTKNVLFSGLLYTLGRMAAYFIVALIIIAGLLSIPEIARFLQKYLNLILGPILIIVGLFLVGLLNFNIGKGSNLAQKAITRAGEKGIWSAGIIGFIFALSFCPVSAGLFFGGLIPVALTYKSSVVLPLIYGIGTALPVILFAIIINFSAGYVGKIFNAIQKFEWYAQRITGGIFVIAGIFLSLKFIFKINV
jgi:cytochrome c-type biogenesis protein